MEADVEGFLTRMYRTEQWLDSQSTMPTKFWEPTDNAGLPGRPMLKADEMAVFVKAFERVVCFSPATGIVTSRVIGSERAVFGRQFHSQH